MRVSVYSRLSAAVLFAFSAVFIGALIWAYTQLQAMELESRQYQRLKSEAVVAVATEVSAYLQSGNTINLNQALSLLDKVKQQRLPALHDDLAQPIQAAIERFTTNAQQRYRALGKLAGNEAALLINAERQLSDYISSLIDYAERGLQQNAASAPRYLAVASDMTLALTQLIHAREAYLFADAERDSVVAALQPLQAAAQQLQALPLLGISEDSAEAAMFSLVQREPKDIGEEIRAELLSLSQRYTRELDTTETSVNERRQGFTAIQSDLTQIQQAVGGAEDTLAARQADMLQRLQWMLLPLVLLLPVLALLSWLAMRGLVLRPLRGLRDAMANLLQYQQLQPLPGADRATEMGEIARYFNQLLDSLAQQEQLKQEQMRVVTDALREITSELKRIQQQSQQTVGAAQSSQQQLDNLLQLTEQLNAASEQLQHNAESTKQTMHHSGQRVSSMQQQAQQVASVVNQGRRALTELEQSVQAVGQILTVIATIAEQTNLLALNAAIESARAGEQGRGFSVVADEVRKLAQKTQQSLDDIKPMLTELSTATATIEATISDMEASSDEQLSVAKQLADNANEVAHQAQHSASEAQQAHGLVTEQSQHVHDFAEQMSVMVDKLVAAAKQLARVEEAVNTQTSRIELTFSQQ